MLTVGLLPQQNLKTQPISSHQSRRGQRPSLTMAHPPSLLAMESRGKTLQSASEHVYTFLGEKRISFDFLSFDQSTFSQM